ncbi:MAG: thermonuclease family protein [Alphaproteobacteria bacterium]|nr:thermonuclease family protein [Alphaproteobacteria bacterium]
MSYVIAYAAKPRKRKPRGPSTLVIAAITLAVAGIGLILPENVGEILAAQPDAGSRLPQVAGNASVIDADTIDIHGERIRLAGVDAPESRQQCLNASGKLWRCGQIAANALHVWINNNPVTCSIEGEDKYHRQIGTCSVRGASMQTWLVTNGYALAYRTYSTAYVPAEDKARLAKAGVWSGEFIAPWDWRKGKRLAVEKPVRPKAPEKIAEASALPDEGSVSGPPEN